MTFACSAEAVGETVVLAVCGEVDVHTAPHLRVAARAALDRGALELVVDLTNARFMDCAGVSALLAAHRDATAGGGRLSVHGTTPGVRRLLRLTGVDSLFPVTAGLPDVDRAEEPRLPLSS